MFCAAIFSLPIHLYFSLFGNIFISEVHSTNLTYQIVPLSVYRKSFGRQDESFHDTFLCPKRTDDFRMVDTESVVIPNFTNFLKTHQQLTSYLSIIRQSNCRHFCLYACLDRYLSAKFNYMSTSSKLHLRRFTA